MISFFQNVFQKKILDMALEQFGTVSIRNFLFFALLGIGLVLFTCLVSRLLHHRISLQNLLAGIVLSLYGSVMLQLTLINRESGSRIGVELSLLHGLTGPDNDFHWMMLAYVVLNCMLFVPFGFVLSLFSGINEKNIGLQGTLVLLLSLLTSLFIETTQLITQRGYYEVQDLFFNTLGGGFGWILYLMLDFILKKLLRREKKE